MNETNLGTHTHAHIDCSVREQIGAIVVIGAQRARSIDALTGQGENWASFQDVH